MDEQRYSRQFAIWGKTGQQLIEQSHLVIIGTDKLAMEVAKSAAILGVGTTSVIGSNLGRSRDMFLDIPFNSRKPKVKSLEEMIVKLNPETNLHGIPSKNSSSLLSLLYQPTMIIDVSNDPKSQYLSLDFSYKKKIPLLTACTTRTRGKIGSYYPNHDSSSEIIIPNYSDASQGVIMSNIFSGILIDEFRKYLFLTNLNLFSGKQVINPDGRITKQKDQISKEKLLSKDIFYNLNGLNRTCNQDDSTDLGERGFQDSSVLVLGNGAIGCYLADMLARLGPKRVDFADYDAFVDHNLNRQPLAYDAIGQSKSQVLSRKIQLISFSHTQSTPYIGFVGDKKTAKLNEDLRKLRRQFPDLSYSKDDVVLMDEKWFDQHRYNLLIAGFDNLGVRQQLNSYATKLGLKYIDCGSSVRASRANIYVPGQTSCLECSHHLEEHLRRRQRDPNDVIREMRMQNQALDQIANLGHGCAYVQGSVNMANQTSAGLALAEARLVLQGKRTLLTNKVSYQSNSLSRLQQKNLEACQCH